MRDDTGFEDTGFEDTGFEDTDLASARRWRATLRRVHRVEIHRDGAAGHGVLHGVGHRRVVRRRVSLPTARGLARLGVPVVDGADAGRARR